MFNEGASTPGVGELPDEYKVYKDPLTKRQPLTDLDTNRAGVLIEEKSIDYIGDDPAWFEKQVDRKLNNYYVGREQVEGWEEAPIALSFTGPKLSTVDKARLAGRVEHWAAQHLGVTVYVLFPK